MYKILKDDSGMRIYTAVRHPADKCIRIEIEWNDGMFLTHFDLDPSEAYELSNAIYEIAQKVKDTK
jgi:hypothetical protein